MEFRAAEYQSGEADFGAYADALRALRDAEYERARVFGTAEARQAVLDQSRKSAQAALQLTELRFRNGLVTQADPLQAKALTIEVRTAILRDSLTHGEPLPRAPDARGVPEDPDLPRARSRSGTNADAGPADPLR